MQRELRAGVDDKLQEILATGGVLPALGASWRIADVTDWRTNPRQARAILEELASAGLLSGIGSEPIAQLMPAGKRAIILGNL
jgi:hypothetical protein